MTEVQNDSGGNVYVLEVKDFDLPVCKIGMTKRDPKVRCAEINKSSTGDFIWNLRYVVTVDDHIGFEALVHKDLERYRQRGRELFNISAHDAYGHIRLALERQSRIKEIPNQAISGNDQKKISKPLVGEIARRPSRKGDDKYFNILQSFVSILQIRARPFGQFSSNSFGVSDGVDGVQWNIAINRDSSETYVGVNLEGMKYSDWPIATFIASEIERPALIEVKAKIGRPDLVFLHFFRDAWQLASRPNIVEKYIGGTPCSIQSISEERWMQILLEARECLDATKDFRGRSKQLVTFRNPTKSGEATRVMEVSPHLTIVLKIDVDLNLDDEAKINSTIDSAISELRPIHEWISRITKSH